MEESDSNVAPVFNSVVEVIMVVDGIFVAMSGTKGVSNGAVVVAPFVKDTMMERSI